MRVSLGICKVEKVVPSYCSCSEKGARAKGKVDRVASRVMAESSMALSWGDVAVPTAR